LSSPSKGFPNLPPTPKSRLTGVPKIGMRTPQPLSVGASLTPVPTQAPPIRVMPPVLPSLPQIPQGGPPPQRELPALPGIRGLQTPDSRYLGMPPLPKPQPATPWVAKSNPSAQLVQQQYVELRLEELEANRKLGRKAALDIVEAYLLARLPPDKKHKKIPFKQLLRVYNEIERNLQSADLTINFKCETWFTDENPYDTYTQMYERAVVGNRMVLRSTEMDDAASRGNVDNQITFPKSWKGAETPVQRGLRPGPQGADRVMKQMDTGPLMSAGSDEKGNEGFYAGNPHFNPHAKQVFLGLNYGRRPHGSAPNFGFSYFVLKSELKAKCLFYAQDTYLQLNKGADADALQVPYDNLGALLAANGDAHLREAIFASCYEGRMLDDEIKTLCKYFLLEAHHFGDLKFRKHGDYMVISPEGISKPDLWPRIVANARKFAAKNNITLFQTT